MNRKSWDSLAGSFEESVLEISVHDRNGVLGEEIRRLSGGRRSAADLGCGSGSLLASLATHFARVHAVDYSAKLLEEAGKRVPGDGIRFLRHDLMGKEPLPFTADVTFCVNALIDPRHLVRRKMARAVFEATKKKGRSVVIVPSFESVLHSYQALVRIHGRSGKDSDRSRAVREAAKLFDDEVLSPVDGIVNIGSVPTKCHTREEIATFLEDTGFEIERVRRVEYSWEEEFESPPSWLAAPYPWDWLVVARRPGRAPS